jgi:hypothetical protein
MGPAAAPSPAQERETGLHYFAVEDLDGRRVAQRGTAGSLGIAFDQLILAPNTRYRVWLLQARTLRIADVELTTPRSGQRFTVPDFVLRDPNPWDTDGDALHDLGEFVLGTNATDVDSDNDGVRDGPEVQQGTNPLDGFPAATGIIGTVDTPGVAADVCALDDVVAVADSAAGVSVFNVFNAMRPVIIAQVDTPGTARRVACAGRFVAVADAEAGLAVIDIADPPAARIVRQIGFGFPVESVVTAATVAYVGLSTGSVVAVDMATGLELGRAAVGALGRVDDLAPGGEVLFGADNSSRLNAWNALPTSLEALGSIGGLSFSPDGLTGRRRLFVGDGRAYVSSFPGYDVFDVRDPAMMARLGMAESVGPSSFKQIVLNGSGLGLAPVGVTPRDDGTHEVSLYDTSDPGVTTDLITTFVTPGIARAVAIFNGIAYVADGEAGLQVINYLAFDTGSTPPAIALGASFSLDPPRAEEGKLVRVTATVSDDVQVRNVEFHVDGVKVSTDGNFPFEHRFFTPTRPRTRFTLRARASDTGGNATWTDEITVMLVPDGTPPQIARLTPADGVVAGDVDVVAALFNEPMDAASFVDSAVTLRDAGPDGMLGTGDDRQVAAGALYRDEVLGAFLPLGGRLAPGRYRAAVGPPAADRAGNRLAETTEWSFAVYDANGPDTDGDGVPDLLETFLALDPGDPDSDNDGTPDGQEDPDADGLVTALEVNLLTDPTRADSDGDGIRDGDEDNDLDGLTDGEEVGLGTNRLDFDSDDDGWPDGPETEVDSDPLDRTSTPAITVVEHRDVLLVVLDNDPSASTPLNTVVGQPPVEVTIAP